MNCHIEFDSTPAPDINSIRPPNAFSSGECQIIDQEIQKFLSKGIIRPSVSTPGDILSPIFVTPKKDGSYRVIFNLKKLNQSLSYYHFKLDTLQTAITLVKPFCYMSSIDLKDAYYSIPIALSINRILSLCGGANCIISPVCLWVLLVVLEFSRNL